MKPTPHKITKILEGKGFKVSETFKSDRVRGWGSFTSGWYLGVEDNRVKYISWTNGSGSANNTKQGDEETIVALLAEHGIAAQVSMLRTRPFDEDYEHVMPYVLLHRTN